MTRAGETSTTKADAKATPKQAAPPLPRAPAPATPAVDASAGDTQGVKQLEPDDLPFPRTKAPAPSVPEGFWLEVGMQGAPPLFLRFPDDPKRAKCHKQLCVHLPMKRATIAETADGDVNLYGATYSRLVKGPSRRWLRDNDFDDLD
jgi:hypothetical protein